MKKIHFLFIGCLLFTLTASAQTQQGYVKTKGRLAKDGTIIPGQRIPSASVILKGGNSTMSGDNGFFSLLLPDSKYFLQNVQKKGYVLTDPEILSKEYNYSKNDLILVMETPSDQWDDKRAAEKAMREQLQKRVDEQREELEKLREEQRVSDEEYRERLQRIFELYDENDKLVNEMAEEYAKIDYDQLDEYNRQIRQHILNGELQEAKSLINSKGNIDQRIADLRKHQEANAKEAETLAKRQEQLKTSQAGTQKDLEDIAQDCYNHFEICKLQHLNDSAAYWIEKMAKLDTTNIEWCLFVGDYYKKHLSNYGKALNIYQHALETSSKVYGRTYRWTAACHESIGLIYQQTNRYDEALKHQQEALLIRIELYGNDNSHIAATSYNNIAALYDDMGDFQNALFYYEKALSIFETSPEKDSLDIAMCYTNMGVAYYYHGDYQKALVFFQKGLDIQLATSQCNQADIAWSFHNVGTALCELSDYNGAIEFYNKALDYWIDEYGENHPNVANTYNSLGTIYYYLYETQKALDFYMKALEIRKIIFGENHLRIAESYSNISLVYNRLREHSKAIELIEKALSINIAILGEEHHSTANKYYDLASIYYDLGNYDQAIKYTNKALNIRIKLFSENHVEVARCYNLLGTIDCSLNKYDDALANYIKANEIWEHLLTEKHRDVAISRANIGYVFLKQEKYTEALIQFGKAQNTFFYIYEDKNNPLIASVYSNIGMAYMGQDDYESALENYERCYEIRKSVLGEDHPDTIKIKQKISEARAKMTGQENNN